METIRPSKISQTQKCICKLCTHIHICTYCLDSSCTSVHVYVVLCAYVCSVYVYEKEGKIKAEEKLFGKRKRANMCREGMRWNLGQGGQIQ